MSRSGSAIVRLLSSLLLTVIIAGPHAVTAMGPVAPAATLTPDEAPWDRERLWSNGCLAWESSTTPRTDCVFGSKDGGFTLALVGDSHLSHLFAGFEALARQRGWRLEVYVKVSCPFLDIPIRNYLQGREYPECLAWNRKVLRRLKAIRPDLTVTLAFRGIHPMDPAQDTPSGEGVAIGRMLGRVPGRRAVLVDTPYSYDDVPVCLKANPSRPRRCRIPEGEVLSNGVRTRERAAARVAGATYLDLTKAICGGFPCRVVNNGIVMFRDRHHLTNTYAATLRDALGAALDRALD